MSGIDDKRLAEIEARAKKFGAGCPCSACKEITQERLDLVAEVERLRAAILAIADDARRRAREGRIDMTAHHLFRLSPFRPDIGDYPAGCAGCGARAIVTAQTGDVRFIGDVPDECPGGLPEFRIGEPTDWKSGSSGNPAEDIRRMLCEQAKGRTK